MGINWRQLVSLCVQIHMATEENDDDVRAAHGCGDGLSVYTRPTGHQLTPAAQLVQILFALHAVSSIETTVCGHTIFTMHSCIPIKMNVYIRSQMNN